MLSLIILLLLELCDFYYSLLAASQCILRVALADEADTPLLLLMSELPDRTSLYRPTQVYSCHLRHSHPSHYILVSVTDSAGNTSASLHADLTQPYDILLEARTHITVVRAKTEGNFRTPLHDLQWMMADG